MQFGSQILLVDTVLRGVFSYKDGDKPPHWLSRSPKNKAALLRVQPRGINAKLSYVAFGRDAFLRSRVAWNWRCATSTIFYRWGAACSVFANTDLIIVSHVAAGDDITVLNHIVPFLQRRRCQFVMLDWGNEYDTVDDKIKFIRGSKADFVRSQLPLQAAQYLYQECTRARF